MVNPRETLAWLPDLVYTDGHFGRELAVVCDDLGNITRITGAEHVECEVVRLKNRAMMPGMVNAHSHAFQRLIRGKTENPSPVKRDTFWTWREAMYNAAMYLEPVDIYVASRMAFLEMALSGITAVGEFHYLHKGTDGTSFDDPNLLAKEVIRAAHDVGIRIALLRVAYARSGFRSDAKEEQKRFIEIDSDVFLRNFEQLKSDVTREADARTAWVGLAPHSVRAVPLEYLREVIRFGNQHELQIHMHVAEQPAENIACVEEHGRTVVALLADENLMSERFTCVHAVHITADEARAIAQARAIVCACPTTERNLGDGIVPADILLEHSVRIAFGSDSQTQIDLLEDARQLEYHLRLAKLERNVLAPQGHITSRLATLLFDGATTHGASSIGATGGSLEPGRPADFFTIDLDDPSIAGASNSDLISTIVFSLARTAIRDVFVGGRRIVEDGRHLAQHDIVKSFSELQRGLWGAS